MEDFEPPKPSQVVENRPHFQVAARFWELFGAQVVDFYHFLENVAVFRPLFQKMWASFDHQTVICKIMGGAVVDILPP